MRKMFIKSLKNLFFLRLELLGRVDDFFCIILCCSFSTLSSWPLTRPNQQISTCLPLISNQKLSINENNLLQYSPKSKYRHFISVSFKLQSHFYWNSFEVPPTQNFFLTTKPFGISWKDLHISKKACDKRFCRWLLISWNRLYYSFYPSDP